MNKITISGGGYTAAVLAQAGANLISLKYENTDILRTPPSLKALREEPFSYGIPILCPPNKIKGAAFKFMGREFSYPKNAGENHLHGILHNCKWLIKEREQSRVRLYVNSKDNPAIEKGFGEKVSFEVEFSLGDEGLTQCFTVINQEDYPIPFGIAYHTAFKVPFCKGGKKEKVLLTMPVSSCCALDEELYPALYNLPLRPFEEDMLGKGFAPLSRQVDMLYNRNEAMPNIARLYDTENNIFIEYKADNAYQYWLVWNDTADKGFVGIEPQTWLSNAPVFCQEGRGNLGIIKVMPNESYSISYKIGVKKGAL